MPATADRRFLQTCWQQCWRGQPQPWLDEAWADLARRYAEPQRHYHGLQHLHECLHWFEAVKTQLQHPRSVALALFFHDAVYEPRSSQNEADSADLAHAALQGKLPAPELARISRYILATQRHDNPEADPDLAYLLDIDLAILGSEPARFAQYQAQIRAEYAWAPAPVYAAKRAQVLAAFLAQEPLYGTAYFQQRLQAQARLNLQHALQHPQPPAP